MISKNTIDPSKPEIVPKIVLFGLIFVNFGPLKTLPKRIPPISEDIHINNMINKTILR